MRWKWQDWCSGVRYGDCVFRTEERGDECRPVGQTAWAMTFKIETEVREKFTVFVLSGRIEGQAIGELKRLFGLHTDYRAVVLDLKEVRVVDREAMGFLARSEADGIRIENCPAYIREWMDREND